jgi:GNAT superfamily N-acetyltransferase
MDFYTLDKVVPDILQNQNFVLVPLTPAHVQVDYEAVMASRKMLHLWSGSEWPREGFTLAENLDDLAWHDLEHREREAFTYTVLDPVQEICLGCVYLRPLSDLVAANPRELLNIGEDEAITRFWVRSSYLGSGLDRRLLMSLIDWFAQEWSFSRFFFHTRQANLQQITLFEASHLEKRLTLQYSRRGGTHFFYGVDPVS